MKLIGMAPSQIVWKFDGPIPFAFGETSQGNNCFAIAAPPAARIAHLKTMARRRFGSSHSTALNKNAPTRMIVET